MRFTRLASVRPQLEIGLESLGCGVLAFFVTLLITQTSYEAVLVIEQPVMTRQLAGELSKVVKASYAMRKAASATRLSTNFVPPGRLLVSCRAETVRDAQAACAQVASAAVAHSNLLRVWQSAMDTAATEDVAIYSAVAALFALVWFVCRALVSNRLRKLATTDEPAGFWTIKRTAQDRLDSQALVPSFRVPPHVQRPSDLVDARSPRASSLLTKVVFRVGGNPYKPDGLILGGRALGRLQELAAELISKDAGNLVVRVASGVSSRYAKSQVTAQLAAMLAETTGEDVVVAEGDIDAPALHKVMRLPAPQGLGFSEQIQRLSQQEGRGTLSVVRVEGTLHALLESSASSPSAFSLPLFAAALEQLRKAHRFVVVDGPVVDEWPDSAHLASGIDAVVWVTGAGTRVRDSLELAERHFDAQRLFYIAAAEDWVAAG